jgi:thiol-disulfide isomerase/thioredoxin
MQKKLPKRNPNSKKVPKIDKYAKVQPKIPKNVLITIVTVFVLIVGLIIVTTPTNQQAIYESYKDNANEYFTADHPFYQLNYRSGLFSKGLQARIDSEEVVIVFLGFPTCPACQAQIGTFQRYFESENMSEHIKYIYYLNVVNDPNGHAAMIADYAETNGGVPRMLAFKDGQVIAVYEVPQDQSANLNIVVRDFFRAVKNQLT